MIFFIKKQILPMYHDSTILVNYVKILYCIRTKKAINLGTIIQSAILTWMETPNGAMPFSSKVEKLCLRFIPSLTRYSQQDILGRVYTQSELNRVIILHQNKKEERNLKTVGRIRDPEGMKEKKIHPLVPVKRKVALTLMQPANKPKVDAIKDSTLGKFPRRKKVT